MRKPAKKNHGRVPSQLSRATPPATPSAMAMTKESPTVLRAPIVFTSRGDRNGMRYSHSTETVLRPLPEVLMGHSNRRPARVHLRPPNLPQPSSSGASRVLGGARGHIGGLRAVAGPARRVQKFRNGSRLRLDLRGCVAVLRGRRRNGRRKRWSVNCPDRSRLFARWHSRPRLCRYRGRRNLVTIAVCLCRPRPANHRDCDAEHERPGQSQKTTGRCHHTAHPSPEDAEAEQPLRFSYTRPGSPTFFTFTCREPS